MSILKAKEYSAFVHRMEPDRPSLALNLLIDHDTALRLAAVKVARDLISLAERCDRELLKSDSRVKRAKALLKKLGGK